MFDFLSLENFYGTLWKIRIDLFQNWVATNPILNEGEIALSCDPNFMDGPTKFYMKRGDGKTPWANLSYITIVEKK